uniref:Uncharacterized protein n=1 Tax=Rhizophora mucronata TaxID=61149 RepID=A0A2P2NMW0_RHIMU
MLLYSSFGNVGNGTILSTWFSKGIQPNVFVSF